MTTARDFLNELKWRRGADPDDLARARVWYVHRGAPGDERAVEGAAILELGRSFMRIASPEGGAMIPFHRVKRVEIEGRVVWERRVGEDPGSER